MALASRAPRHLVRLAADRLSIVPAHGLSARVLSPGGRFGVSDVVTENHLTEAERAERGGFVGCIAGALSVSDYRSGLDAAGFADVSVEFTHAVDYGVHAAIVRAVKPAASLMSGHGA